MDTLHEKDPKDKTCDGSTFVEPGAKDIQVQLVISLALGLSAFLAFCILRPRWKTLYAARKRRLDKAIGLPTLPDTFFGWIPALYKVTEEQVLASAGLDAYVFLSFFKMAMRICGVLFFFAAVVLEPINQHFVKDPTKADPDNSAYFRSLSRPPHYVDYQPLQLAYDPAKEPTRIDNGYKWAYLIFTYFFTFVTIYFMSVETYKILRIRQDYLGTQSTITDRTFRLSGIPNELRSEGKIKQFVEKLEIGMVDSVTLCRQWRELDDLVADRAAVLRKLEESWSVYLGQKTADPAQTPRAAPQTNSSGVDAGHINEGAEADEESGERGHLLPREAGVHQFVERERPVTRVWYGLLRLQSRRTDALDYYEEKLRRLDEKITAARKKEYDPTDLAFVTMDSIAACQMAIQALIDPRPGRLLTKPAPAPSDVIWSNTYASRISRRARAWIITLFIMGLTVVWLIPVAFLASLLSLCTISKVFPELAESLSRHDITKALVQTGLPTAVVSLLNVCVPFLYHYLSTNQGMQSQGDVELSAISKNFFFIFFNIFLVFTVFGTATSIWDVIKDSFKDTTYIALTLATKIQNLNVFYLNFIMLQGIGLFPFRLLEFGSVAMYPIMRMGAKTPRDYAEMVAPPVFTYGFYLPTALLVFLLCLVYSVLPRGFLVLLLGLLYFAIGYFTYKYQLLYAMDQPQHATGGAWRLICYRVILGLVVFQVTMAGFLALKQAFVEAAIVVPLVLATLYYTYYFKGRFEPLTRFISLRVIRRDEDPVGNEILDEDFGGTGLAGEGRGLLRRGSTIDEEREKGLKFVNPSLIVPLEQPWIYHDPPPISTDSGENGEANTSSRNEGAATAPTPGQEAGSAVGSTPSSISLGDTHIWRENGPENV